MKGFRIDWKGLSTPIAQHRLIFALWGLFTLVVITAGLFAFKTLLALRFDTIRQQQTQLVEESQRVLLQELGYLERLPGLLRKNPDIQDALRVDKPVDTERLAREFRYFVRFSPLVSQLRWLDETGQEKVRINVRARTISQVPDTQLQSKQNRDYFRTTIAFPGGKTYVSAINLNIEHGAIVTPFEPTFRAAIRTGRQDHLRDGVLIANFNIAPLLARLRRLGSPDSRLQLLDDAGYWLLHPDSAREWGRQKGQDTLRLPATEPALWQRMNETKLAEGIQVDGEIWSFASVRLSDTVTGRAPLRLLVGTQAGTATSLALTTGLAVGTTGLVLILLAGVLALRLARAQQREGLLAATLRNEKQERDEAYQALLSSHEQLTALQDELVETRKLSSLGTMVAGVADELNTPAGGALMTLESLKSLHLDIMQRLASSPLNGELSRLFGRCSEGFELAQNNIRRIVDLVRSFKRLAVDRAGESPQRFLLRGRIEDLEIALEPLLRQRQIQLDIAVPPSLGLRSYPGVLSQVLQNLLDNAIDHGFEPGQPGLISITAQAIDNQMIALEVSDNGRGIDAHIRNIMFDPFVTSGRDTGHTGLGLYLVRQWVTHVLKGQITIESTPGRGTRVLIRLPVSLPDNPDAAPPPGLIVHP